MEKLYADLLALPDTKVKEALDIQDDIDTLEDYRKKLETLQRMRYERSGGLQADMGASGTIGGNVAGNTGRVDLAALVRPVLPSAEELEAKKKELQGVSGFDIIAKIDLRNNEAEDLRRQLETVPRRWMLARSAGRWARCWPTVSISSWRGSGRCR